MDLPDTSVDAFDLASLDSLRVDLLKAGFEVISGSHGRDWLGPLPDELWDLTKARQVQISIRDGWPYMHPHVFIAGLSGEHVSDAGLVCLWNDDDISLHWLTWQGIRERLVAWGERARLGFNLADAGLDAFMGFTTRRSTIATFNLPALAQGGFHDGKSGRMHAVWCNEGRLDLRPGRAAAGELAGRWFYRHELKRPPRNFKEFLDALTVKQRAAFERGRNRNPDSSEGPLSVAALVWPRHGAFDVLVFAFEDHQRNAATMVLEPAPVDTPALLTRAGRDAPVLVDKAVVIFGVGAVGGYVGLLLAEHGLARLRLVDDDRLRPSNVVRHVASDWWIGEHKVIATTLEIRHHAPWTNVQPLLSRGYGPASIRRATDSMDLVIDTTGHASFSSGVAKVAWDDGRPLISATLFRNGAVGRIRRQTRTDIPFVLRSGNEAFVHIPPEQANDEIVLEVGCSSPVNLASPSSVVSIAAAAVRMAVDILTGRLEYPADLIETYHALGERPFDKVGQIAS